MVPGGSNDNLVGGIAVKRFRQVAAVDENRTGEFPDAPARNRHCLIEPVVNRAIEDELLLLDFLGNFPHGDEGELQVLFRERGRNRGLRSS